MNGYEMTDPKVMKEGQKEDRRGKECKEKEVEYDLYNERRTNEYEDRGKMKGKEIRTAEIRTVKERRMQG